jgi:SAM-dependent methyltransferase
MNISEKKEWYDKAYEKKNYFKRQEWLFKPYISSLVSYLKLNKGASLIDVGCGQGFFSYLFQTCGMKVYGVDISETAIHIAKKEYGSSDIEFIVGDAQSIPVADKFDCVFVRSCSLYNSEDFPNIQDTTDYLLNYVKDGGIFIFTYFTRLYSSDKGGSWYHHSYNDVKRHFSKYRNTKIFFISKLDTILLNNFAFNSIISRLNLFIFKLFGLGGDLVCIIKKV